MKKIIYAFLAITLFLETKASSSQDKKSNDTSVTNKDVTKTSTLHICEKPKIKILNTHEFFGNQFDIIEAIVSKDVAEQINNNKELINSEFHSIDFANAQIALVPFDKTKEVIILNCPVILKDNSKKFIQLCLIKEPEGFSTSTFAHSIIWDALIVLSFENSQQLQAAIGKILIANIEYVEATEYSPFAPYLQFIAQNDETIHCKWQQIVNEQIFTLKISFNFCNQKITNLIIKEIKDNNEIEVIENIEE